jgi:ABC-type transport system substrate-binding protein
MGYQFSKHRSVWFTSLLVLLFTIACGATAPPDTEPAGDALQIEPTIAPTAAATPAAQQGATPTAVPQQTPEAPQAVEPAGTLNVGHRELGPFVAHPKLIGNPQILIISASGLTESLLTHDPATGELVPMLAEEWSISDDFLTWTWKIRQGVQFHKGYGEMTAEDVVWSHEQTANSLLHARAANIEKIWFNEQGSIETPDDYTIVLNTGEPIADITVYEVERTPSAIDTWIVSKKQTEEIGEEDANTNIAATGPYEIEEHGVGTWRLRAVRDHWRQTPFFDELVLLEVPEEAARVAGFQTGNLDTFVMALDSIPQIETVQGAEIMRVPLAGQSGLNIYGQTYVGIGTPQERESFDPNLPWVSSNPDINSPEWQEAMKVRLALSLAIDRQLLVDALLQGFGQPLPVRDWAGAEERMPEEWVREYNPDRARELLAEAGYPDGFSITLSTAIRGAPSEVETCEAIAQMWEAIGLDVDFQRIPYGTLRPTLVARTYTGATCHSISVRLDPALGLSNYTTESVFSYGTEHPFLEGIVPPVIAAVDPQERDRLTLEAYQWFYDNAIGAGIGLYTFDNAWAVGPKINPWLEHVRVGGDLRTISGVEYIEPR